MPYALAYLYSLMGFKVLFKNAFEEAHGKEKGEKVYKEHYGNSHDKTVKICTILSRSRDICRKDLLLDKLFTLIRRSMQQNISLPESVAETIHLHL